MDGNDDILSSLERAEFQAAKKASRGLIIQSGAIGDCILTLPVAKVLKSSVGLGQVDMIGRSEYIEFLPGRSCIDGIRSIETIDFHRLFSPADRFHLEDDDRLVEVFADYKWVVTFLGEAGSDFEQNLIFTVHCSHTAEVMTLALKPHGDYSGHISSSYIEQMDLFNAGEDAGQVCLEDMYLRPSENDIRSGRELLYEYGVCGAGKLVVIHPGSGGVEKCWGVDNFCGVAEMLRQAGFEVVFLSGPAEDERFDEATLEKFDRCGKSLGGLTLSQVLQVLSCSAGFIGNDSGISHLAGAMGVKTVSVFGPTDSRVYKPLGPHVKAIQLGGSDFSAAESRFQEQICMEMTQMLEID